MRIFDQKWLHGDDRPTVHVYRNLNNGCWSVRSNGLVVAHAEVVVLDDAEFHVNENGRQRVIQEQRKNVHAYVKGKLHYAAVITVRHPIWGVTGREMAEGEVFPTLGCGAEVVSYNPYKGPHFTFSDGSRAILNEGQRTLLDEHRTVTVGDRLYFEKVVDGELVLDRVA